MSNSSFSMVAHPVVAALDAVDDALGETVDAAVWALTDAELEAVLARSEEIAAKQAELRMRLVAEADGRDLGRRHGATSTASWLRGRYRIRAGDARALVETANRITASVDGPTDYAANVGSAVSGREMPATAAALAAGQVSEAHAVVINRAMRQLPTAVDAVVGTEVERQLATLARQFDPGELGKVTDTIIDALSPDSLDDDEDDAVRRRELRLSEHTGRISGRLDPEAMAMVRAMLDPLAAPNPSEDGQRDERAYPKRLADALVEITRRVLGHTDWLPDQHGARPHLNVTTQLHPDSGVDDANEPGGNGAGESAGETDQGSGRADAAGAARAADGPAGAGDATSAGSQRGLRLGRGEPTWGGRCRRPPSAGWPATRA